MVHKNTMTKFSKVLSKTIRRPRYLPPLLLTQYHKSTGYTPMLGEDQLATERVCLLQWRGQPYPGRLGWGRRKIKSIRFARVERRPNCGSSWTPLTGQSRESGGFRQGGEMTGKFPQQLWVEENSALQVDDRGEEKVPPKKFRIKITWQRANLWHLLVVFWIFMGKIKPRIQSSISSAHPPPTHNFYFEFREGNKAIWGSCANWQESGQGPIFSSSPELVKWQAFLLESHTKAKLAPELLACSAGFGQHWHVSSVPFGWPRREGALTRHGCQHGMKRPVCSARCLPAMVLWAHHPTKFMCCEFLTAVGKQAGKIGRRKPGRE